MFDRLLGLGLAGLGLAEPLAPASLRGGEPWSWISGGAGWAFDDPSPLFILGLESFADGQQSSSKTASLRQVDLRVAGAARRLGCSVGRVVDRRFHRSSGQRRHGARVGSVRGRTSLGLFRLGRGIEAVSDPGGGETLCRLVWPRDVAVLARAGLGCPNVGGRRRERGPGLLDDQSAGRGRRRGRFGQDRRAISVHWPGRGGDDCRRPIGR